MKEKTVMVSNGYDRIDGRNAYQSDIKRLTLGAPMLEENKKMQIAAQIWKLDKGGELILAQELPVHQIFDLIIFCPGHYFTSRRLIVFLFYMIQKSPLWNVLEYKAVYYP